MANTLFYTFIFSYSPLNEKCTCAFKICYGGYEFFRYREPGISILFFNSLLGTQVLFFIGFKTYRSQGTISRPGSRLTFLAYNHQRFHSAIPRLPYKKKKITDFP